MPVGTGLMISNPPLFWNLPTAILGGVSAAAGLAVINSVSNLFGLFGPAIVGWVSAAKGGTGAAISFLAGRMCVAGGMIFLIPARLVNR